ncbi:MAG: protein translocase subunit SecD [Actinomycetota bacterium]
MSENAFLKSARKKLVWLVVIIFGLAGIIGVGAATNQGASFAPKLALDLQGGTEIILSPLLEDGKDISEEQLAQAVSIIRQRVDATGVSEAQINTQGNGNIIVSIPGTPDENTLKLIRSSAKLEFRPVLAASASATATVGEDGKTTPAPATSSSPIEGVESETQAAFDALDCTSSFRAPGQVDDPTKPLVTCDTNFVEKYILGPVEIEGSTISDATAGTVTTSTGASTNTWAVNLDFNNKGTEQFAAVTKRLFPLTDPNNRFAITLDGYVITAPSTNAVITNGSAQITGSFDRVSSKSLADQLKYGALPIGFEVQSQANISATLGSEQLSTGLLAGLVGLILVVIYSVFQYRGLAIVTIGSLIIAAILVYLAICVLSWRQGYRLSLAGVAGLIVAIGITADSFIVYFERVRDELRDGRGLDSAVDHGWKRALRTIIVSDGVSILAAVTLFALTVGNVRGFAYTLGLTTLIDLAVVALFTHPMLQILARTRFFASQSKWSGFDSESLGANKYTGRGTFRVSDRVNESKAAKASKEASKRQALADRKSTAAEKKDQ